MQGDLTLAITLEFSGVPEDSNFPLLGVWASPSHLAQSGVAPKSLGKGMCGRLWPDVCYAGVGRI
jgi:hypothetical protein